MISKRLNLVKKNSSSLARFEHSLYPLQVIDRHYILKELQGIGVGP